MMTFGSLLTVVLICFVPGVANAQIASESPHRFVDLTIGADWDDAHNDSVRAPGATWASGFSLGIDSKKSGVEIDVTVPQWHVKSSAPQRYQYVGPSAGYTQHGHFYEASST